MATYVFSDVHGHVAPLARLLSSVSPSDDDAIFMLGDMIDRGPDPVGVMLLCRDLPGCTVLRGNHEDLMLSFFDNPHGDMEQINWILNGGGTTAEGLAEMPASRVADLLDWVGSLPLWAQTQVGERRYLMAHAGIRPTGISGLGDCEEEELELIAAAQSSEDLIWIREEFWEHPTGLVNEQGRGPIVIAGHTPTPYLLNLEVEPDRPIYDENGHAQMIRLGACPQTGGVADRWDIDCCAASGYGRGQVLLLRLDDGKEFYEPVGEGE